MAPASRTRGLAPDADSFVEATFVADQADVLVTSLAEGQRIRVRKETGETDATITVEPAYIESRQLNELAAQLRQNLTDIGESDSPVSDELSATADQLEKGAPISVQLLVSQLLDVVSSRREDFGEELLDLLDKATTPIDISTSELEQVKRRIPRFVRFEDADRLAQQSFPQQQLNPAAMPRSLRNLLDMARVDKDALWRFAQASDHPQVVGLIAKANDALKEALNGSWNQARVSVTLTWETASPSLRVMAVEDDDEFFETSERSAGLLWFISLVAFLKGRHAQLSGTAEIILLVDEAETHLHYDGQADLMQVMASQQLASSVIYTTHSAGCLPSDLSKIRTVVPSPDRTSRIQSRFWSLKDPGLSRVLVRMGATAFAFSRLRAAVITEALLTISTSPRLFTQSVQIEESSLPFQIVPGLSEATAADVGILDLEAARVTYLVDGDQAGGNLREKLSTAGIPPARIFTLPTLTVEDLIDRSALSAGIVRELRSLGVEDMQILDSDSQSSATWIESLYQQHDLAVSGYKVSLAETVLEDVVDNLLREEYVDLVAELYTSIIEVLELAPNS